MSDNFLGRLSDRMANTRGQMFRNQMEGAAFNVEMDKEANKYFGQKAQQVFQNTQRDVEDLARRLKLSGEDLQNNFEFYRNGTPTFSPTELRKIANLKWDNDPNLQKAVDRRTYEDGYIKNYTSESGFDAAAVGTNKKIGKLGYDPETDSYNPTVITYDPQRRQAYEADFTIDGEKVSLGGEPATIPGYAFEQSLRNYMVNIQKDYLPNLPAGMANLVGTGQDGKRDPRSVMENIGGPQSFDPTQNIAMRKSLATEAQNMGPPAPTTTTTTTTTALDQTAPMTTSAQTTTESGGVSNAQVEQALLDYKTAMDSGQPVPEETKAILKAGLRQNPETGGLNDPAAIRKKYPQFFNPDGSQKTDAQLEAEEAEAPMVAEDGSGLLNKRTGKPLDETELTNMVKGPQGYSRFITQMDRDNSYIYQEGVVPVKLSLEQFNAYTPEQQRKLITAAKAKSDENVARGLSAALEAQGVSAFDRMDDKQRRSGGSPRGVPIGSRISVWEEKNGELIPIEGMSKKETFKAVKSFYDNADIEGVLKSHPAYFAQLQELGAVEFAKRYLDDPEFAKNIPTKQDVARNKVTINQLAKTITEETGISFNQDGSINIPTSGGAKRTTFNEDLQIPVTTSSAVENVAQLVFTNVLDDNISEADLKQYTQKQRVILGMSLYGSLPPAERQNLLPQIISMVEFGVFKPRADMAPDTNEVISAVNTAFTQDRAMNRDKIDYVQGVIDTEQKNEGLDIERARLNQSRISTRNTNLNALRTDEDRDRQFAYDMGQDAIKFGNDTRKLLVDLRPKGGFFGTEQQGADIFTAAAGLSSIQLKNKVDSPEFMQSMNLLAQRIYEAQTNADRLQIQGLINNGLKQYFRGKSSHWFLDLWRGSAPKEVGDLTANIIFLNADGQPFFDMNQVYSAANRDGEIPASIGYYDKNGVVQRGQSISPTKLQNDVGSAWYAMALSTAIQNANNSPAAAAEGG
tara:strand:+ start:772 stop:3681 length:2910 start_codon:yes stop_codon:yes gene_type:complete